MRTKKVEVSTDEPIILPDTTTSEARETKSYTVKKGDTIQSIASQLEVEWKTLAKNNGISSPYILKVGQKIKP